MVFIERKEHPTKNNKKITHIKLYKKQMWFDNWRYFSVPFVFFKIRNFPREWISQKAYNSIIQRKNYLEPSNMKLSITHITGEFRQLPSMLLFHIRNVFVASFLPQNTKSSLTEAQSFLQYSGKKTEISANNKKLSSNQVQSSMDKIFVSMLQKKDYSDFH